MVCFSVISGNTGTIRDSLFVLDRFRGGRLTGRGRTNYNLLTFRCFSVSLSYSSDSTSHFHAHSTFFFLFSSQPYYSDSSHFHAHSTFFSHLFFMHNTALFFLLFTTTHSKQHPQHFFLFLHNKRILIVFVCSFVVLVFVLYCLTFLLCLFLFVFVLSQQCSPSNLMRK